MSWSVMHGPLYSLVYNHGERDTTVTVRSDNNSTRDELARRIADEVNRREAEKENA